MTRLELAARAFQHWSLAEDSELLKALEDYATSRGHNLICMRDHPDLIMIDDRMFNVRVLSSIPSYLVGSDAS